MMFFYSMSSVFDNFIFKKNDFDIYNATLKCKKRSKILWKILLKVGRYMYIIKFNEPWNFLHGFKKSRDGPLSTRVFDSFYKVTDSNPFLPNSEKLLYWCSVTIGVFLYQRYVMTPSRLPIQMANHQIIIKINRKHTRHCQLK